MNACPVYTSIGGHAYGDTYPGPVGAVLTPASAALSEWSDLAGASSLCGACRDVCPVRLDIPRMLLNLRAESAPAHGARLVAGRHARLRVGRSPPLAYARLTRFARWRCAPAPSMAGFAARPDRPPRGPLPAICEPPPDRRSSRSGAHARRSHERARLHPRAPANGGREYPTASGDGAGPMLPPVVAREAQLARFRDELEALGVSCAIEPSAAAVRERVRDLVRSATVLSWDDAELPYGVSDVLADPIRGSAPRDRQAAAAVGLTGCDGAIAETGSLVMLSRPGRSPAASLLPPFHIAIVRPHQLYATIGEFFAARESDVLGGASCTFITGPSRTADIELTLTLGIHGPGRVAVVIGPDSDHD